MIAGELLAVCDAGGSTLRLCLSLQGALSYCTGMPTLAVSVNHIANMQTLLFSWEVLAK